MHAILTFLSNVSALRKVAVKHVNRCVVTGVLGCEEDRVWGFKFRIDPKHGMFRPGNPFQTHPVLDTASASAALAC